MDVDLKGDLDVCVAQPLRHDLRIHTGLKEEGRAGMPEIIEAEAPRELGSLDRRLEVPVQDVAALQGPAGGGGEDQVETLPLLACSEPLFELEQVLSRIREERPELADQVDALGDPWEYPVLTILLFSSVVRPVRV
jgi:hypothetical protein